MGQGKRKIEKIILASGSKNRQLMLKTLGVPFRVLVSGFNEGKIKESDLVKRASKIALAKAKRVAKNQPGIIISGDTFSLCEGQILEKPKNLEEAMKMLSQLSDNKAICYTGFAFLNKRDDFKFVKTAITKVVFRKIYEQEISDYVKKFPVTTWAAAYAISDLYVSTLVKRVSGSLTGLTHGLPTEFLIPLLEKEGYLVNPGVAPAC